LDAGYKTQAKKLQVRRTIKAMRPAVIVRRTIVVVCLCLCLWTLVFVEKVSVFVTNRAIRFETRGKQSHGATNASTPQPNPTRSSKELLTHRHPNPFLERPTLLLPTPIIVMGFPKGGTSSIFSFFQQQGLRSQHWYCCKGELVGCFLFNFNGRSYHLFRCFGILILT